MAHNSKKRFSSRVDNYVKYRPGYPVEIIDFLQNEINFLPDKTVADIGSGTGIFTELLLKKGYTVYGVEPNPEMRKAAEKLLSNYPNFISINGSAELTNLQTNHFDFITAAQAFHWFDTSETKEEFKRILKPEGYIILIWNSRRYDTTFMRDYEKFLINNSIDYRKVAHQNVRENILKKFFNSFNIKYFSNHQVFNFEEFKGRVLSSSYMPDESHNIYKEMIKNLTEIFNKHQVNGKVEFIYETEVYYGKN